MATFRQVFVVQCCSNGLFVSGELGFVRSLKYAGKAETVGEAVEIGLIQLGEDFEVHSFWVCES